MPLSNAKNVSSFENTLLFYLSFLLPTIFFIASTRMNNHLLIVSNLKLASAKITEALH